MRVEKLFKQLKREYLKVKILQGFLDSILFFQLTYLTVKLFSISFPVSYPSYTVITGVSAVVFAGDSFYRSRGYSIEIYEEANPELGEILRTAHDNLSENSLPAERLFDEVKDTARKISSESIIQNRAILGKVIAISFLSFATVVAGVTTIHNMDIEDPVDNLTEEESNVSGGSGAISRVEFGKSSEVLGKPDDFDYESREISFDYSSKEAQGFSALGESYEGDVFLKAGSEKGINYRIARDYSLAIKDIEQ